MYIRMYVYAYILLYVHRYVYVRLWRVWQGFDGADMKLRGFLTYGLCSVCVEPCGISVVRSLLSRRESFRKAG